MKKFLSDLNHLYKLDNSVSSLVQKLACLEKLKRGNSFEYKRYLTYLDVVSEEEENFLKSLCQNEEYLDLLLFLHMQNSIRHPNYMLLAINEPYEKLNVNRIYYLLLDFIIERHNTGSDISFEYAIEQTLKTDLYIEFLGKLESPELTYKLSYLYPPLKEKLVFNGFKLKDSMTPDILLQFYEEQNNYDEIRKKVYSEEFIQTFYFLLAGHGGIDNFEMIMTYLKVVSTKLNNDEFIDCLNVLRINFPRNWGLIEEIVQFLEIKRKKLD